MVVESSSSSMCHLCH